MTKIKKQKQDKRLFSPVIITVVLMVLFFAGNSFEKVRITTAQENGNAPASIPAPAGTQDQIETQVANRCVTELAAHVDPLFEKYKIFMEDNFKNKSSTSSLMNLGIQRYDLFKQEIFEKYRELIGVQLKLAESTNSPNPAQGVGLNECNLLALQYVDDASKLLKMRAITTSNVKKASIFVEKYKQINGKLRSLNLDVMRMVVNISAFQQKLPCYLKSCI